MQVDDVICTSIGVSLATLLMMFVGYIPQPVAQERIIGITIMVVVVFVLNLFHKEA